MKQNILMNVFETYKFRVMAVFVGILLAEQCCPMIDIVSLVVTSVVHPFSEIRSMGHKLRDECYRIHTSTVFFRDAEMDNF
jgi:hypothetical protein